MNITSQLNHIGPYRYDMSGRSLPRDITGTEESLPVGIVKRLVSYAVKRMNENGFPITENVRVEKNDDESWYYVSFINTRGGEITVGGIMIRNGGWPSLDHGFSIHAKGR